MVAQQGLAAHFKRVARVVGYQVFGQYAIGIHQLVVGTDFGRRACLVPYTYFVVVGVLVTVSTAAAKRQVAKAAYAAVIG